MIRLLNSIVKIPEYRSTNTPLQYQRALKVSPWCRTWFFAKVLLILVGLLITFTSFFISRTPAMQLFQVATMHASASSRRRTITPQTRIPYAITPLYEVVKTSSASAKSLCKASIIPLFSTKPCTLPIFSHLPRLPSSTIKASHNVSHLHGLRGFLQTICRPK